MSDFFDQEDVKRRERLGKRELDLRERELDEVRLILGSKQGRRFWLRYLNFCGVFSDGFTGNNTTFFNCGQRSVGLQMIEDMNAASPESYFLMLKEKAEEQKINELNEEKEKKKENSHA